MELKEYEELKLKKGTIHSIHWKRTLRDNEVLKGFKGGRITKETIGNFRIGVTYANMAINKEKVTGDLPYGYFALSNEIIYSPSTETYQLRLTLTGKEEKVKPIVKWFLDGVEITKDKLIEMGALGANARKETHLSLKDTPVFNLPLKHIILIK